MKTDITSSWGEPSPFHDPAILANFRARPSDVLITTAPKAGTTWMQQILFQLKSGGDDTFVNIDDVVPWLEFPRQGVSWQQRLEQYEKLDDPRLFKTHCTYEQTPGVDVAKIILSSRDPRDCCTSYYHHIMALTDDACTHLNIVRPASFDDYFEQWMSFGAWYRNVKSWWPHYGDDNVLWLRYEDMVVNLEPNISSIAGFLDWRIDRNRTHNIFTHCSFTWMKQHSEKFHTRMESGESMFLPGGFIRKGRVGDHKNLLSAEQEKRIIARARKELEPQCLAFIGLE